jgi:LPS-assembly protein
MKISEVFLQSGINRRNSVSFVLGLLLLLLIANAGFSDDIQQSGGQLRTERFYKDGIVILLSDRQEQVAKDQYHAEGHISITFQDVLVTGDTLDFNKETREGTMSGHVRFSQQKQWLVCSRADFNFGSKTGTFYDASGFTDREFFITGRTIIKTGPDTYRIEEGFGTTCQQKTPKWSLGASLINLRVDRTARMHSAVFKIKSIPVFYFPYLIFPMEKKTRSSGLIPFHTGNSTSKGRVFSEGYYQTLGKSADVLIYGDYFSLRGLAVGGILKLRPNPDTRFNLEAYGIQDKLKQGGIQLTVDGESRLGNDWKAVARVNISSNFTFRQAFADSFRAATVSQERATAFLNRNHGAFSTNIAFEREEVLFPTRSLVIRKLPSLEFLSLGTPLGRSPFIFSFRASLEGMSRVDSLMETPRLIQRMDLYPRLSMRLPSLGGFSLVPSFGARETYYGAQMSEVSPSGIADRGLHRRYADFSLDLRMPELERDFSGSWFGNFEHVVEPFAVYRRTYGIRDLHKTIRFDEEDAIADTNEIEYGIINRFFRQKQTGAGIREKYEFMSFGLTQKHYFDPTFGGAFRPGQSNSFYPLDSLSGFFQTMTQADFSPISVVFRLTPRDGIHNEIRADFDPKLQSWRDESYTTLWDRGKLKFSGTYFRIRSLESGALTSNHVQGQVGYGSTERGFSSSLTISYNLRTSQLLNSNTRLNYMWDCCGVALEFNQFDLGLRTESRFSFSFMLKGIGSFGNIKHPESLF